MTKPNFSIKNGAYSLRPLESTDLQMTLKWRNREGVRQCFINKDIIHLDQHLAWYQKYESLDNDIILIGELSEVPIAQLASYKIDREAQTAEIGRFVIAHEYEGKGHMSIFLSMLLENVMSMT